MANRKSQGKDLPQRTLADILPRTNPRIYDQDLLAAGAPVLHSGLQDLAYNLNMDVITEDEDHDEDRVETILDYLEPEEDINMDLVAQDYTKSYESENLTLEQPSTVPTLQPSDVEKYERKVLSSKKDNPLDGISRDVVIRLQHLPYLAAINDLIEWPANDVPKFVGTEEDVRDRLLPILSHFPTSGPYPSLVNKMLQKTAADRGMLRQAAVLERVTSLVKATSNENVDMNKTSAFYEALIVDNELDDGYLEDGSANFIDDDAAFGNTDFATDQTEQDVDAFADMVSAPRPQIALPIQATDLTNTRIASFLATKDMTPKQVITALEGQGMGAERINKILGLVKAHMIINKQQTA